jgi:outer membrane lipoprotein SlyB
MKTLAITALALGLTATSAFAETVTDHYKTIIDQKPYTVEVCKTVQVGGGNNTEGAIVGGLIGGLIGNQFGKGDGKEAATGVGAIIGAIQGGKSNGPVRTQQQCQYETRYEESTREVYSHSIVTFTYNGKRQSLKFIK